MSAGDSRTGSRKVLPLPFAKPGAPEARDDELPAPPLPWRVVAVIGGSPGAGATTLAANLAAEASLRGVRAVWGHEKDLFVSPASRAFEAGCASTHSVAPKGRGPADYVLLDPAPGSEAEDLADYVVLVVAPQRSLCRGVEQEGVAPGVSAAGGGPFAGPFGLLGRTLARDPWRPVGLVVNRAAGHAEGAALAGRFATLARAFLGGEIEVLGWILEDPEVRRAKALGAPVVRVAPLSAAAAGVRQCARNLWRTLRPRRSMREARRVAG